MRSSARAVFRFMTSSNFVGGLNRKFGRIGAFEDPIQIVRRSAEQIEHVHAVRQQASFIDEIAVGIDYRYAETCGQRYDELPVEGAPR
jgi:hypothetical protein